MKHEFSPETILAAKVAAVAVADFWDALRAEEQESGKSFDNTMEFLDLLASNCDVPANIAQITDDAVREAMAEHLQIAEG